MMRIWCPWVFVSFLGYKNLMYSYRPLVDSPNDKFPKQEYLSICPYVVYDKISGESRDEFCVCVDNNPNIILRSWLKKL